MEIEVKPFPVRPAASAADSHDMQHLSSLAQPDIASPPALEKIAASIDLLRLEMQGIRLALEALVAKP
jgi:hypothetical protein